MTNIYIGTKFDELRLITKGDFSFNDGPYVVLFNKQARKYYAADDIDEVDDAYDVSWSADVTANMIPGVYTLEVYDIDSNDNKILLVRKEAYAQAVIVSESPEQENGVPQP